MKYLFWPLTMLCNCCKTVVLRRFFVKSWSFFCFQLWTSSQGQPWCTSLARSSVMQLNAWWNGETVLREEFSEMGRRLSLCWLEVLECKCSLFSLQVKFQESWNLRKFHHWLHQSQHFSPDAYLIFKFIARSRFFSFSFLLSALPVSVDLYIIG